MSEEENSESEESKPDSPKRTVDVVNAFEGSTTQSISSDTQTSTEQMEVHHHPDLHHKKKKFREYFLEFIMIFLAVTLGFFAEGLREHISESSRAKEYALMLLKDVIKDTIELHSTMKTYQNNIGLIDTLQKLRRSEKANMTDMDFYYYSRPAFTAYRMSFNDATLLQVKNSGNLRYFRSLKLKEKISEYDNIVKAFYLRQEFELNWVPVLNGYRTNLFEYDVLFEVTERMQKGYSLDSLEKEHYIFLIKDAAEISRFLIFCDYRKIIWETRITGNINPTLAVARQLIALLKNEYGFSNSE